MDRSNKDLLVIYELLYYNYSLRHSAICVCVDNTKFVNTIPVPVTKCYDQKLSMLINNEGILANKKVNYWVVLIGVI